MIRAWLAGVAGQGLSDADRLGLITGLEELKAVTAAAQVRVVEAFDTSQRCAHVLAERDPATASRSVGSQLGLALRCAPSRGDQVLSLACALTDQMPHTLAALGAGQISEQHAREAARATAGLRSGVRERVDAALAGDLAGLSPLGVAAACRRVAAQLDAAGMVAKSAAAARSRRVSVRPAPDGMAYLCVLGPLPQIVGAYATVRRDAQRVIGGQARDEHADGRGWERS